jgi:hypothetical protein
MYFYAKKAYRKPTVGFLVSGFGVIMAAVVKNMTKPARAKTGQETEKKMRKIITPILCAALFAAGGCNTPVNLSGDYATPTQTIAGDINATTNAVTVSGSYSTTNQTIGGAVTVGK